MTLALFAVAVAYAAVLVLGLVQGAWLMRPGGYVATDFTAFWAGGRLALAGEAAAAYDWPRLHALQQELIGPFRNRLPWLNPPSFFLFVAPVAALPYVPAWLAWLAATGGVFVLAIRRIVDHPAAVWGALAFPATLITAVNGQGSFLTAGLLGGALLLLPGRPVAAGILIGCLTVKPQLGLLLPLALVACGAWRAVAAATATALALALASALVFGPGSWTAFAASLGGTGEAVLAAGLPGWGKMQSLLGALRNVGVPAGAAWTAQALLGLAVAVGTVALWRRPVPHELKAAGLALGTLLVQPYMFVYDATILAVAIAFLVRLGLRTGFGPFEAPILLAAPSLILASFGNAPNTGLLATLAVGVVLLGRLGRPIDAASPAMHNRAAPTG